MIQEYSGDSLCVWLPFGRPCNKKPCKYTYNDLPICNKCFMLLRGMLKWMYEPENIESSSVITSTRQA